MELDGAVSTTVLASSKPYKVKEVAQLADLSPNAVYQMIARGELPAIRLGGAIRLPRDKIDRLLRGEPG